MMLNLGSGQRPFPKPWINIDCQLRWKPDRVADARDLPYNDRSAQVIVLHHMIEHLHLQDAAMVLRESHRVLCPGGSLIVATPDLFQLVRGWLRKDLDDYLFAVNLYGAYMGDEADTHKWIYTRESLTKLMAEAAPWRNVGPFNWRQIESSDIARDWWILALEAIR